MKPRTMRLLPIFFLPAGVLITGFLFLAGFLFLGCQQNPFPTDGITSNQKQDPPASHDPPAPLFVLDFPDVMNFHVKEEREYTINASVPSPGHPIVTAYNLPKGAHFSNESMKLRWMPGSGDTTGAQAYVIQFVLQSSLDSVTTYERSAVLLVKSAQEPQLAFDRTAWVTGTVRSVALGQESRVTLPITDRSLPAYRPDVRIIPETLGAEIQWRDQQLLIEPREARYLEFDVAATASNGAEEKEHFALWVQP